MSYENLDTVPKTRLSSFCEDDSRGTSLDGGTDSRNGVEISATHHYLSRPRKSVDKYDRLVVANPYARHGSFGGGGLPVLPNSGGLLPPTGNVALRRASFIPGVWETYASTTTVDQKENEVSSAINSYNLSSYHTIPKECQPPCQQKITKRRALKNVIILGLAFVFVYSAFISLQSLKSTMHPKDGLGVISLSCVYATTVLSCFLAPWIIKRVSTKWTIVVSFILFSAYFTTHFYPFPETIIPSSIILGIAAGPLWGAQATYITTLAVKFSQTTGQDGDYLVNKFLCLFCGLYQTSQIWGNIISVMLITSHPEKPEVALSSRSSPNPSAEQYYVRVYDSNPNTNGIQYGSNSTSINRPQCGVLFCTEPQQSGVLGAPDFGQLVEDIPQTTVYLLVSIYLGCGVMAIVIATALLERFDNTAKDEMYSVSLTGRELCLNTWDMLKDFRCLMLLPLVTFVGMQQAFMFGDFTKFYINCTLGVSRIGEIFICFGTVSALSAITIGYISKHIKRIAIVTAGAVFNIGLLLVLWLWRPLPIDLPNFFVVSGCLGLCDAIWQTQTYTLFGVLFMDRQEAAFSTYRMFLSTGCAVAFGYSHYLCVEIKVYILASVLIISLLMYSVIEVKLHWQSQHITDIVAL